MDGGLALRMIAAGTIGGTLSNKIGDAQGSLNFFMHKLMHAGAGAITGAVLNPDDRQEGARAGAIGAAIAETMAEVSARAYDLEKVSEDLKKEVIQNGDQSEKALSLTEERNSIITKSVNIARFGTLGVAWLAQQDPSTAAFVGMMTVEHNFLDHLSLEMMTNPEAARETEEQAQVAREWVHEKTGIEPAVVSILVSMGPVGPLGELATMISRLTTAAENIGKARIPTSRVNPSGAKLKEPGVEGLSKIGRQGRQKRLKDLARDAKLGASDKGWLKQELNQISRRKRTDLRNPPGTDLAHKRGFEAAKGYDYRHSQLQGRDLHKLQHKFDALGRKNKTPTEV